jgi:adenine phosphoribosyltransferase
LEAGGEITECCFANDLPDLGGRKRLETVGMSMFALVDFKGDRDARTVGSTAVPWLIR